MKRLMFLCMLLVTSVGFSFERYQSDAERMEEIFSEFNENLEKIGSELNRLNSNQIQLIDILTRLSEDQHHVEVWSN